MVTVHKFGGGILRDAESYARAAHILKTQGPGQVAVVSASFGVTDQLDAALQQLSHAPTASENGIERITQDILQLHLHLLDPIQNAAVQKDATKIVLERVTRLSKILYGAQLLQEITPRTIDLVHSFGERLSAPIMHAHLRDASVTSESFDADAAGLLTDQRFGNATPDFETTATNLRKTVLPTAQQGVAVFTGYFGISAQGHVTTLGRGGSDYSAGIVAHALDAAQLWVWKDVEGFMSADPKVIPAARWIAHLTYDEAEELGYFGAKILHPKTLEPLRRKSIPVQVKSVFHPQRAGTIINGEKDADVPVAQAVAVKPEACMVCIHGAALSGLADVAIPLLETLQKDDVPVDALVTSQADLSFCVEKRFLPAVQSAIRKADGRIQDVSVEDVALLGLVGEGMRRTVGVSGRLFSALAQEGVNVRLIGQGASEINITFAVARTDADAALKAVHAEFLEGGSSK